jgi:hypothetical protein
MRFKGDSTDVVAAVLNLCCKEIGEALLAPRQQDCFREWQAALKAEYGCQLGYQRERGVYALTELGELALLDLPAECMEALAFFNASASTGAALPEQLNLRPLPNLEAKLGKPRTTPPNRSPALPQCPTTQARGWKTTPVRLCLESTSGPPLR